MQTLVTIPQQVDESFEVIDFHFRNGSKIANVTVAYQGRRDTVQIDFTSIVTAATVGQRTTVKWFFKLLGVEAINQLITPEGATSITDGDVTGDLFPES